MGLLTAEERTVLMQTGTMMEETVLLDEVVIILQEQDGDPRPLKCCVQNSR